MGGQIPTPYFDANDGWPSYLLINNGDGTFVDGTESAGLAAKRNRRTYSCSFVDLDRDGDLDLVVVSDFAMMDVYENNGAGHFTDSTVKALGNDSNTFGMSHVVGDFNADARPDLLVMGMSSTTARRLDLMGAKRQGFSEHQRMRSVMGYGNRLFLTSGDGYRVHPHNDDLARTGWSWGSTALDFDNDADLDIYIANGHKSGKSCKDYCTTFWRHDIFEGNSEYNKNLSQLFADNLRPVDSGNESWNGYEHNALLVNEGSNGIMNVGHFFCVALERYSRSVIGADINKDGRVDLLVNTSKLANYSTFPGFDEPLHIYRNTLPRHNNWIGVVLREEGRGFSPHGAVVTMYTVSDAQRRFIVSGDSFRAQHPPIALFGLGNVSSVARIDVCWPNGVITTRRNPAINRYHAVRPDK